MESEHFRKLIDKRRHLNNVCASMDVFSNIGQSFGWKLAETYCIGLKQNY